MAQALEDISPTIVTGADGVRIDTETIAFDSEIPLLPLPSRIRSPGIGDDARDPRRRRQLLIRWIEERADAGEDPIVSATSVAVEQPAFRDLVLLIADGKDVSEGRLLPSEYPLSCELRSTLATWSGMPLASQRAFKSRAAHTKGVKYGLRSMSGPDGQHYEQRGGTLNMYREYPARFDVGLVEARRLLSLYGWRLAERRSNWWLYEVGGPLEHELALWLEEQAKTLGNAELAERAREICPAAFKDDDTPSPSKRRGR